jgi:alpha-maltose-1-phosphate synthase
VELSALRVLMLTPDAGFLDRRIAQEAATLAHHGATVDIYPTHEPLAAPVPETPGVRMVRPHVSEAAAIRSGMVVSRVKRPLTKRAPWLRRVADAARYVATDRAARLVAIHDGAIRELGPYGIVFAHDLPVLPLAAHVASEYGSALVCDFHEIFPEADEVVATRTGPRYWRAVEATYLPAVDGVLCVNEAVADYLRRRYAPRSRIAVVSNAVPYVAEPPVRSGAIHALYGLSPAVRVMTFGGTLRSGSNLSETIDGFGRAQLDGWVLAILGSGPLQGVLEEQIITSGLSERVHIGRRAAQEDLINVLASADVGLIPYLPDSRNLQVATPNKLYEYIQARLPIASMRLPMIERVIAANGNGAFVDFSTVATTARDLRRYVEIDLPSITRDALELAARHVSWERDEDAFIGLVRSALADHQSRVTAPRV